jgi:hypothetical protein
MKGTMLLYRPESSEPLATHYFTTVSLSILEQAIGGPLEQVYGFNSIERSGALSGCIAFANADRHLADKQFRFMLNDPATALWQQSLQRDKHDAAHTLTGNVVVLTGDGEFLLSFDLAQLVER